MVAACYEIVLNRSYQELTEHYDTAIVPARVEHPKNKSLAKGTALKAMRFSAMAAEFERQLDDPAAYSHLGFEEWIALCHFTRELLPSVFEISIIV